MMLSNIQSLAAGADISKGRQMLALLERFTAESLAFVLVPGVAPATQSYPIFDLQRTLFFARVRARVRAQVRAQVRTRLHHGGL
jgi:hypothetical protein